MTEKRESVLIVEDRLNWRELLQELLEEDFKVASTKNYKSALGLLESQLSPFQVAIIDVRLDDTNPVNEEGLKLISEIKKRHQFTQIIVVTAYPTTRTTKIAFQDLNVFDYIEKYPEGGKGFDYVEFRKIVYRAVQEAKKQRETLIFSFPVIGFVTALPKELIAMQTMLENMRQYDVAVSGGNQRYFLGEIPASNSERHQVALALLPDMGTNPAAIVTSRLLQHFPSVNDVIMVGIAGGVPNPTKPEEHVRLGDVVISGRDGIVQYDYVKEEIGFTKHRHAPRPPRANLLNAVRLLEAGEKAGNRPWLQHIRRADHLFNATRPSARSDRLRDFAYPESPTGLRHPRDPKRVRGQPRIFVGPIASANTLLKNPHRRDELRDKFGVKAVEMEGSGVADATWIGDAGYLVIRGICDYCDPDKMDKWQEYAAVVAAAYTRALLESMPAITIETDARISSDLTFVSHSVRSGIVDKQEQMQSIARTALRQKLERHFNVNELRTLCFDLGVDHENIPALTKEEMTRELVLYCERYGRTLDLLQRCRQLRPNEEW